MEFNVRNILPAELFQSGPVFGQPLIEQLYRACVVVGEI
jgi:hypothetical protein